MHTRSWILGLAATLSIATGVGADPGRQLNIDTADAFLGAFLHGRVANGRDNHLDVFGGANWSTDVAFRPGGRAPLMGGPRTINLWRNAFAHQFAPHGEPADAGFARRILTLQAQPGAQVVLADFIRDQRAHQGHQDEVVAVVLALSANNDITQYFGLVAARHVVPERQLLSIDFGLLVPDQGARVDQAAIPEDYPVPPAGLAALVLGPESEQAQFGLGLLGEDLGEVERVALYAGPPEAAESALFQAEAAAIAPVADSGFAGVVEIPLGEGGFERLRAGAHVVVTTSTGRLTGRLSQLADEAGAAAVAPYCRATVPVRVAAGRQGPATDACKRLVAMTQAFDASSDHLCAGAECQGDCRLSDSNCKPQIPFLPDPRDFTCGRTPLEECEGGQGWRCFWQNPQWFDCDCACR